MKNKINEIKNEYKIIKEELNIIQPPKKVKEKISLPSSFSFEDITKITNQMMNCICHIKFKNKNCTGFFSKIIYKDKITFCLITNNEIINDNYIKNNKEIKLFLNEGKQTKTIGIDNNRIKYINNQIGISIIQINKNEGIKDFLEIDNKVLSGYLKENGNKKNLDKSRWIYVPHYQKTGNIFLSCGIVKEIKNNEIVHTSNINDIANGSSGAPILDMENKTVIGIYNHKKKVGEQRYGIFLDIILNDFIEKCLKNIEKIFQNIVKNSINQINNENQIKLVLNIPENLINEEIFFLNGCYCKKKDNKFIKYENETEINKNNIEIIINGKKSEFCKSFIPTKTNNEIIVKFKNPIKDCSHMFQGCDDINEIDLSKFNSKSVKNMESMFAFCDNLKNIDLSSLDTTNVEKMDGMFFFCKSLEKIKIKNLGNKETSLNNIFYECSNLRGLDLSSIDENDNFDFKKLLKETNKSVIISIKKQLQNKVKFLSKNVLYI